MEWTSHLNGETLLNLRLNSVRNEKETQELSISINQLNIKQSNKQKSILNVQRFDEITKSIINNENNLIIFSETDYPFIIKNHDIVKKIQHFLQHNQTVLIGGIQSKNGNYYNSLYAIKKNAFEVFDKNFRLLATLICFEFFILLIILFTIASEAPLLNASFK